jgi:hypothetical protein
MIGELRFIDAIQHAKKVWELIKEKGKEDETKRKCRNVLT